MLNTRRIIIPVTALALATAIPLVLVVDDVNAQGANKFNRLMKPPAERNQPPTKDGIHDPENLGTEGLQPPRSSFGDLPKGTSGNYVNWVKALSEGKIEPRFDRLDPDAKPVLMDLKIVRQVKGSMPDVIFPHKEHTDWLDCSNCHPAIFVPQKGANQISMASILLGEKCGVCHGKVAFPVAECRLCHAQPKGKAAAAPAAAKATPAGSPVKAKP